MNKFKVGEMVMCVVPTTSLDGFELEKNKIYTIKDIKSCRCEYVYDVGFPSMDRVTRCHNCGVLVSTDRWFLRESRFVKDIMPLKRLKNVDL